MKEKLNLPERSTIRYEQVTCGKDRRHDTHRYYYAYTWDCNSKKLKKKYIGKQLPLPTVILGQCLYQGIKIRVFHKNDSERVKKLISDIIVNEFNFKLEFNTLDSDILSIEENYNNSDGGCFWIAESIDDNDTQQQKIVGTTAVRNLKQFEFTCELKRMYVLNEFRRLGLAQKLLDIAIDFAKSIGYSRMVLDSSKTLYAARALYLKKGFVDIPRYNDNYRADVFMERKL